MLNVAYYTRQAMLDSINPYSGTVSIKAALGPIDADYYLADTTVEYHSKIKGVLAQWGSLTLPPKYSDSTTAKKFFDQRIPDYLLSWLAGLNCFSLCSSGKTLHLLIVGRNGYRDSFNTEKTCLITSPFKAPGLPRPRKTQLRFILMARLLTSRIFYSR